MTMSISVVIPVHNSESWIEQAVGTVMMQSVRPNEVILVDDGSTDGSLQKLRELASCHPAIHIVHHDVARGPAAARNSGWRRSSSEWVAFLDSDDLWHRSHLESLKQLYEMYPTSDVLFSRTENFISQPRFGEFELRGAKLINDPMLELLIDNPIPQSAVAVRRWKLVEVNGYDENIPVVEDYELWCRLAETAVFAEHLYPTVARRIHGGQLSVRRSIDMHTLRWHVRSKLRALALNATPPRNLKSWELAEQSLIAKELSEAWRSRSKSIYDAALKACGMLGDWRQLFMNYYPIAFYNSFDEREPARATLILDDWTWS